MSIFTAKEFDRHEQVVFCHDAKSGLKAIIAIHNRNLGPALGGCRIFPYANEAEAVRDVLRLSRGMTYKSALAGLPLGGGKSVIIGDPLKEKSPEKMRAMGRFIDSLGGRYIGAEDSGTGVEELMLMATETQHVAGVRERRTSAGPRSGDPSPSTAYGTFVGIRAAVQHALGRGTLEGVRVAIQGMGHVGIHLAEMLHNAGAKLWVSDPVEARLQDARARFGATPVALDAIYDQAVDVFAPCAMGAVLNDRTIPRLQAVVVAGAANNQLDEARHAAELKRRGILYAPDYVINAGGIIDIYFEIQGDDEMAELKKLDEIGVTLTEIFREADAKGVTTAEVADRIAERRFQAGSTTNRDDVAA